MPGSQTAKIFEYNFNCLKANLEGITHDESVKTPSKGVNSVNWLVGHLVLTRDLALRSFQKKPLMFPNYREIYDRGRTLDKKKDAADLELLKDYFAQSQKTIERSLKKIKGDSEDENEHLEYLTGLAFHESYHIGQIGVVRKLIGKEGAIL